ncbi:MAG: TylF/MycF/NovP-related O-methyltransferase [Pseudomonadota bacterium]
MYERGGALQKALTVVGRTIPGTDAKTWFYLNMIYRPRRFGRNVVSSFYRMDHIYEVLNEFKQKYNGQYSILEFGVADGYAFTKKLHATKYCRMSDRVQLHGFDTFEGLPEIDEAFDRPLIAGDQWEAGTYKGRYEDLQTYCEDRYDNFALHRGLFEETLTDAFLETLLIHKPILIWIDCDLYSSTKSVFDRLVPYIPTGCVIYFDDIYYNFGSRFTGEMRAVHEINSGCFGEGVELVPDRALTWDSNRIYRFVNLNALSTHEYKNTRTDGLRFRGEDSPFP